MTAHHHHAFDQALPKPSNGCVSRSCPRLGLQAQPPPPNVYCSSLVYITDAPVSMSEGCLSTDLAKADWCQCSPDQHTKTSLAQCGSETQAHNAITGYCVKPWPQHRLGAPRTASRPAIGHRQSESLLFNPFSVRRLLQLKKHDIEADRRSRQCSTPTPRCKIRCWRDGHWMGIGQDPGPTQSRASPNGLTDRLLDGRCLMPSAILRSRLQHASASRSLVAGGGLRWPTGQTV